MSILARLIRRSAAGHPLGRRAPPGGEEPSEAVPRDRRGRLVTASLEARLARRAVAFAPAWLAAVLLPATVHEARLAAAWEASRASAEIHRSAEAERALHLSRADIEGAERISDQRARRAGGIDFPGRRPPPDDLEPWVYDLEGELSPDEAARYMQGRAPRRLRGGVLPLGRF